MGSRSPRFVRAGRRRTQAPQSKYLAGKNGRRATRSRFVSTNERDVRARRSRRAGPARRAPPIAAVPFRMNGVKFIARSGEILAPRGCRPGRRDEAQARHFATKLARRRRAEDGGRRARIRHVGETRTCRPERPGAIQPQVQGGLIGGDVERMADFGRSRRSRIPRGRIPFSRRRAITRTAGRSSREAIVLLGVGSSAEADRGHGGARSAPRASSVPLIEEREQQRSCSASVGDVLEAPSCSPARPP